MRNFYCGIIFLLDFNFPDKAIEICVWSSQVPQPTQSQAGTLSSLVSCRLLPINRFGTASANSQSECLQRSSKCSKLSVWVGASNLGVLKLSVCLKLTMQMLETLGVLSVWNLRCKFLKWNLFQVNCDGSEQEVIKKKKDLREKGKRSIQPVHRRKPKVH